MEPLLGLGVLQPEEGMPCGRHPRIHAALPALNASSRRKLVVQQLQETPRGVRVFVCYLVSVLEAALCCGATQEHSFGV